MQQFTVNPIGAIEIQGEEMSVRLKPEYIPALQGLEGFSHIDIFWWFSGCDNEQCRSVLENPRPYRLAPEVLGTFATRSPMRPNPIALTVAQILYVDYDNGVVGISYTDALPGTPVLDLKPYTPSIDRVGKPGVPDWCGHWPADLETSGDFDWENEFLF